MQIKHHLASLPILDRGKSTYTKSILSELKNKWTSSVFETDFLRLRYNFCTCSSWSELELKTHFDYRLYLRIFILYVLKEFTRYGRLPPTCLRQPKMYIACCLSNSRIRIRWMPITHALLLNICMFVALMNRYKLFKHTSTIHYHISWLQGARIDRRSLQGVLLVF